MPLCNKTSVNDCRYFVGGGDLFSLFSTKSRNRGKQPDCKNMLNSSRKNKSLFNKVVYVLCDAG